MIVLHEVYSAKREVMGKAGKFRRRKAHRLDGRHEKRVLPYARSGAKSGNAMAGPLAKAENPRRKIDVFHLQAAFDRAVAEDDVEELQEVDTNIVFRIGDRRAVARPTCRVLLQHFQPAEDLVFDIALRHRVPGNLDGLVAWHLTIRMRTFGSRLAFNLRISSSAVANSCRHGLSRVGLRELPSC